MDPVCVCCRMAMQLMKMLILGDAEQCVRRSSKCFAAAAAERAVDPEARTGTVIAGCGGADGHGHD